MVRGRTLAIALGFAIAAALIALIALRDSASDGRPASTNAPASSAGAPGTTAPSTPPSPVPPLAAEPPRSAHDAGASNITQALRATDEHDRALLAAIERQTKASPSKAVYALIALRRRGAGREALEQFIARELWDQLLVRIAAQRWLRAVMQAYPGPAAAAHAAAHGQRRRTEAAAD